MTKLKINIKKKDKIVPTDIKKGAYLATFDNTDDRIIFFNGSQQSTVSVINILKEYATNTNELHMQQDQAAFNYTNLKKIKKMTIKVELE